MLLSLFVNLEGKMVFEYGLWRTTNRLPIQFVASDDIHRTYYVYIAIITWVGRAGGLSFENL
jgi:hypothetical protein